MTKWTYDEAEKRLTSYWDKWHERQQELSEELAKYFNLPKESILNKQLSTFLANQLPR